MEFLCEKTSCKLSKTACAARYAVQNAVKNSKNVFAWKSHEAFASDECVNCTLGKKHLSEIEGMSDMTAKNKRGYVRLSTSRNVEFSVDGGRVYMGLIENKSDNGVFIETGGRFSEGRDISMTIESTKFEEEKRTGKIARVTQRGIGVKFT